mmetsp:Transcript_17270/g.35647  ORF Transcript_17270/g.35647 Transcript_17270/m.35647 type:complete len:81 (+) Transcript_17270:433-675(+)
MHWMALVLLRGGIRYHSNTMHGRGDPFGVDPPTEHRHVGDSVVEPVVVAAVLPVVRASHDGDEDDYDHGGDDRDRCSQIV